MTWDAAMQHEMDMTQIRADHGHVFTAIEDQVVGRLGSRYGTVSIKQGVRNTIPMVISWVLGRLESFESLTPLEQLAELRKGTGSLYHPVLAADPTVRLDCAACESTVIVDRSGQCPDCGHTN